MDAQTRVLLISQDVTSVMKKRRIPFKGNFGLKFSPDLGMSIGAFEAFLDYVQDYLNEDSDLDLLSKFEWQRLPGEPVTGRTFPEYYLTQTVTALVMALDSVLSVSPYS